MTQWWRRGAPSEAGTISSVASEEGGQRGAQAAPSEGEGARWGDAGVGGVTREQALVGAGVISRRSNLRIDIAAHHNSRDNLRETPVATVLSGGGGGRGGDGNSRATRAQNFRANAIRIGALLMYAALIGFFLVILLGGASRGSKLHFASLLVVACIMGLWFATVCYRCVVPPGMRNEPAGQGMHQRTPISLQEFLAMNHPMTPLRTGVDAKVRQSFRYFRYNDPGDSSDAALADAELDAPKPGVVSGGGSSDSHVNAAGSGPVAVAAAAAVAGSAEDGEASVAAAAAVVAVGTSTQSGAEAPWAEEKTCSICLDEFRTGHELCALPCLHTFHSACLGVWLSTHTDCPLCKVCLQPLAAPTEAADAPATAALTAAAVTTAAAGAAVTENVAVEAMRAPSHGGALAVPVGPDNV